MSTCFCRYLIVLVSVLTYCTYFTYLLTCLLAYLLYLLYLPHGVTARLEKLTGSQLVKKFPAFYGTRRFITAFTSARQLFLF